MDPRLVCNVRRGDTVENIVIAGRTFQLSGESTARHDIYTMRQIAACGLNLAPIQGGEETDEQFQYRLYATALQTGDIFLLLGSLLVPEGTEPLAWTVAMATDTATFLAGLTAAEDKAKLRILLASALTPFFASGRRSSRTSPTSSTSQGSGLRPIANEGSPSMGIGV
jgi:hypothetical protein